MALILNKLFPFLKVKSLERPVDMEIKSISDRLKKNWSIEEREEIMNGISARVFNERRHIHRNPQQARS